MTLPVPFYARFDLHCNYLLGFQIFKWLTSVSRICPVARLPNVGFVSIVRALHTSQTLAHALAAPKK